MAEHQIYAAYDDEGIYVYQAFKPSIVQAAIKKGTFGAAFKMERMTWIKPSFGWMLYRAGYAQKEHQEAIVKIKLSHAGFQQALSWSVASTWNAAVFDSYAEWQEALKQSPVRVQWDPDRDIRIRKLERRAIQIGLSGKAVEAYVNQWIIGLEDVTDLAHAIKAAIDNRRDLPSVPDERVYPLTDELKQRLDV